MNMRIGHGYDAHRLVADRKLILGGVEIPYEKGLQGHSDADVLTHAVVDALLGAMAMRDIGCFFPDDDPSYRDVRSIQLLGKVRLLMGEMGWTVGNVDATIVAQAPKLKSYILQMREQIAQALSAPLDSVSVKATTEEQMGFTGNGEGISAHAVCLLERAE